MTPAISHQTFDRGNCCAPTHIAIATNALANSVIIGRLQSYNVSYEQLLAAQAQVESVANGIVTQQQRKGITQASKRERDTALQALDRWMLDFMAVARIALADRPERLAHLGLASR
jgi:hypothetical protein